MNLEARAHQLHDALTHLERAGVRFVQVEMPDLSGQLRGKIVPLAKALSPSGSDLSSLTLALRSADEITMTAWTNETNGFPKITAVPDPDTAVQWPWRPDMASVLSDWFMVDGSPCPMDGRQVLRRVCDQLLNLGYEARAACEFEVYLYKDNPEALAAGRYRDLVPWGRILDAYSLGRSDGYAEFAVEYMTRLLGTGIPAEMFHTEYGHGMNEFTMAHQPAVKAADAAARSKLYLRQLGLERGMIPTFMPVPGLGEGDSFAGCHHNLSLWRDGTNALWDPARGGLTDVGRWFLAGMLRTMREFHILFRPWINSHRRVDRAAWNPDDVSWGIDNHITAIRVVHGTRPEKFTRYEHRAPGADVNFYLSLAAMLWGGLRGLQDELEPPEPAVGDPGDRFERLPKTMDESIDAFANSENARELFGDVFIDHLVTVKRAEVESFQTWLKDTGTEADGVVTDWELAHYFEWV